MNTDGDYTQFVIKAQQGDRTALNALADRVKPHLLEYVVRMTMDTHLAQDLVQESLMTMVQEFDNLRDPEQFWFWLTTIALNNVRAHYRRNWRRSKSLSRMRPQPKAEGIRDTVAEVIGQELKQIVLNAMHHLPPEYRAVLAMRCYDQLTFPQISQQLGCREFKARALFSRAKRALGKNLTKNGLGKASLLGALVVFGKVTAVTEATVTETAVAGATLKAGFWPALAVALSGRAAITLVSTVVVSVVTVPLATEAYQATWVGKADRSFSQMAADSRGQEAAHRLEYYFPPGNLGVVHIQTSAMAADEETGFPRRWLQNAEANYWCNGREVFIKNADLVSPDLAVMRLPTDGPRMRAFLDRMESRPSTMEYIKPTHDGLLVIVGADTSGPFTQARSSYDISDEQVFKHPWPASMKLVDERDALHRQGWCSFRMSGEIKGKRIQGTGRIPLVLSRCREHFPWLRLSLEETFVLEDSPNGARISREGNRGVLRYRAGVFWRCLPRPWQGLHTLDTIRRDAAQYRLWFATERIAHTRHVAVTVVHHKRKIIFTIDMDTDLVQRIRFFENQLEQGRLSITYHQDAIEDRGASVSELPRRSVGRERRLDTLWMLNLMKGDWE